MVTPTPRSSTTLLTGSRSRAATSASSRATRHGRSSSTSRAWSRCLPPTLFFNPTVVTLPLQLLRDSATDPSEPRDDVVVSEAVHPFAPPTLLPRPAYPVFDQELRETSED